MEFETFLAKYCPDPPEPWHIHERALPSGEEPAGILYSGSVRHVSIFADIDGDGFKVGCDLPEGFEEIEEFALCPYRFAWKNDQLRAMVTYCEGDVSVTVDRTLAWYQARLRAAQEFYARHRS